MPYKPFSNLDEREIEQTVSHPCNKCGELTINNLAGHKLVGSCTCKRCMHAYFCFMILHEMRRASFQKKETQRTMAERLIEMIAEKYKSNYGSDWREQLRKIDFPFEIRLLSELNKALTIEGIAVEARENGFIDV